MDSDFPKDIKEFIGRNIHSVAQLEVLLTLHDQPDRLWSAEEVTSRLYLQRDMVHVLLMDLVQREFVARENAGFQYRPANESTRQLIDRLVILYQERRVAVTAEIFSKSKPIDFVKSFADAFRLRGKE